MAKAKKPPAPWRGLLAGGLLALGVYLLGLLLLTLLLVKGVLSEGGSFPVVAALCAFSAPDRAGPDGAGGLGADRLAGPRGHPAAVRTGRGRPGRGGGPPEAAQEAVICAFVRLHKFPYFFKSPAPAAEDAAG